MRQIHEVIKSKKENKHGSFFPCAKIQDKHVQPSDFLKNNTITILKLDRKKKEFVRCMIKQFRTCASKHSCTQSKL